MYLPSVVYQNHPLNPGQACLQVKRKRNALHVHISSAHLHKQKEYHPACNNPLRIPMLSTAEENPARIPMNHLLQIPEQDLSPGSKYLHGVRAVGSTWFFPFHSSSRRTACHWSGMQDEEWNLNTAVRHPAVFVTVCSKKNYNHFNNSTCATSVCVGK